MPQNGTKSDQIGILSMLVINSLVSYGRKQNTPRFSCASPHEKKEKQKKKNEG
jgi:hypothetical protein